MNLHPAILRVNKRLYYETSDLLYNRNIFEIELATPVVRQCTGGQYPDSLPDPPDLIRNETDPKNMPEPDHPGFMYPGCLQRMRHIRLVTSRGAIWAQCMAGYYPSHMIGVILEILDILACEYSTPTSKSLEFNVKADWRTKHGIFAIKDTDAKDWKVKEIARGLCRIKRTRVVHVEEKAMSPDTGKLEIKYIDIERLISHMDDDKRL